jgi:hypothetical protein
MNTPRRPGRFRPLPPDAGPARPGPRMRWNPLDPADPADPQRAAGHPAPAAAAVPEPREPRVAGPAGASRARWQALTPPPLPAGAGTASRESEARQDVVGGTGTAAAPDTAAAGTSRDAPPAAPRLGEVVETGEVFAFPPHKGRRHTHIMGGTGMGKSKLLEALIRQDMEDPDTGLCLIDPHGPIYDAIVRHISHERPELAARVVLFDPSHEDEYVLGFNPFSAYEVVKKPLREE